MPQLEPTSDLGSALVRIGEQAVRASPRLFIDGDAMTAPHLFSPMLDNGVSLR